MTSSLSRTMSIDSPSQVCPDCRRTTVIATHRWGRQRVHLGTWLPSCIPDIPPVHRDGSRLLGPARRVGL
jgi:hypothetical protein